MPADDPEPVKSARADFLAKQSTFVDKLYAFEVAREALRDGKRRKTGSELLQLEDAFVFARGEFNDARDNATNAFMTLQGSIATWLPAPTQGAPTAAEQDISRLESTDPIVMFPVRIETRFDGNFLKVRISPDDIFLNTHETALTPEEAEAGTKYWESLDSGGFEPHLWRDLIARFGVPRSAYILRTTSPGSEGEPPDPFQLRAASWTRPGTAVLPDRWAVYVYKNDQRRGPYYGGPIVEPLQLTPDPKIRQQDLVTTVGGQKIDPRIEWIVNFDTDTDPNTERPFENAVKVGMGIAVPLEGDELTTGLDRVLVVGVKTSMGSNSAYRQINDMFDAHHFTSGLALVRHGEPTNNMEGRATSYPLVENAGERSFVFERQTQNFPGTSADGFELRRYLNLNSNTVINLEGALNTQLESARAMNLALWPATLGYFLQKMMADENGTGIFSAEEIARTRSYFNSWVAARGVAPSFRVGGIPYGVLPVAGLARWKQRSFNQPPPETAAWDTLESKLLDPLQRAFELWREATPKVHRIHAGQNNPDVDLAHVLSTHASAREYRVRRAVGIEVQLLFLQFLSHDIAEYIAGLDLQNADTFGFWNHSDWRPRIGRTFFAEVESIYTGEVVAASLSETAGLMPNFIDGILSASIEALTNDVVTGKPAVENLFYKMLRHSTLTEYVRAYEASLPAPTFNFFFELFGGQNGPTASMPQLFSYTPETLPDPDGQIPDPQVVEFRDSLEFLKNIPTAELDRLFGETLDLVSHRLDAWITAFANRRLALIRPVGTAFQNILGAYGWVEDVRPATPQMVQVPGLGPMPQQANTGGFIHAPSMTHASAAAVLRSGHMSMKNENASATAGAYAVDLSSRRVRMARRLLEGVRNGQPLGALLGYEFERGLHEGHPGVSGLDEIRFAFRKLYPFVANKDGQDGSEPAESIAARNVVDGSVLLLKRNTIPWGTSGLPSDNGSNQFNAVKEELDRLEEMLDATADLQTAEGVFQLVRGNIDAAVPTISNIVDGLQPPPAEIVRSARGGVGIAHRVALVFPHEPFPVLSAEWENVPLTPRSAAERTTNAWLTGLIGNPEHVLAKLTYRDAEGNVITSTHVEGGNPVVKQSVTIALSELRIHPLDLLALAEALSQDNQGSMLDRRIVSVGLENPNKRPDSPPARFEVTYDLAEIETTIQDPRSFPQSIEVLNAASNVLGSSRSLAISDLVLAEEADEAVAAADTTPDANALAFYERTLVSLQQLDFAIAALATSNETTHRIVLVGAAHFAPLSAFPDPALQDDALGPAVTAARSELERRRAALPAPIPPDDLPTAPRSRLIDVGTKMLKGIFGPNFPVLPPLTPPGSEEIERALAVRADLLADDLDAPDRYLQQVMRSRERLGRYRKLALYARTAGLSRPRADVVQLPHQPGERWLGLPFAEPDVPPEESRLALMLLSYTGGLDADAPWAGLVLDDWTEIIPNRREDTGITFNYEGPRAKAPQCVLVAVPSGDEANWVWEELVESVEQALDLAKFRCVDGELLEHAQIHPAAVFATNENPINTVSTPLSAIAQAAEDALDLIE